MVALKTVVSTGFLVRVDVVLDVVVGDLGVFAANRACGFGEFGAAIGEGKIDAGVVVDLLGCRVFLIGYWLGERGFGDGLAFDGDARLVGGDTVGLGGCGCGGSGHGLFSFFGGLEINGG